MERCLSMEELKNRPIFLNWQRLLCDAFAYKVMVHLIPYLDHKVYCPDNKTNKSFDNKTNKSFSIEKR